MLRMLRIAHVAPLLVLAALTGCPKGGVTNAPQRSAAEIPIKRVILYQNGVGYFERQGRVNGDRLTLQIRPTQINDLLKSLTVIDRSSGRAVSVSLPLEKTGAQILSELPEQVRSAGGLLDVLRVFRGARVKVIGSAGSVTGRIIGVEPMDPPTDDSAGVARDWRLTLKTGGEELRVYPVSAIEKLVVKDRTLSFGLDQSLDVSLNEGNWKPIAFDVRLIGADTHDLSASYIIEMPQWKPAYRLVISEGAPLLQGWAVVDNVSGEDWNQVQLSLVAGTPMSFIYDLHSPKFPRRVDLTPRGGTTAPAPVIESVGREDNAKDSLQRRYAPSRGVGGSRGPSGGGPRSSASIESYDAPSDGDGDYYDDDGVEAEESMNERLGAELERQAPASAEGARVGALFRYDIKDPVTIPDRSSTLVAIVNQRVPGKEVVLFRPELTQGAAQSHPYRAVMFKNDTGFTLEKGPVTIYAQGTFVGEGFVERMEAATTTFLTYSIDGSITAASEQGTVEEGLRLLKIVDGLIVSEVLQVEKTAYTIENHHEAPITAYVKTLKRQGWKLRKQPKETVETADALIVPAEVAAQDKTTLTVEWVRPTIRRAGIDTGASAAVLQLYLQAGKAPPAVQKQLEEVMTLKGQLDAIAEETQRLEKQHRDISNDQERVRQNIKLLTKTRGNEALNADLVRKLAKLEQDLGALSGRLVRLSEQRAELSSKMTVLIRGISLTVADE